MIPASIKKEHVLQAIREIDAKGVPIGRCSRKFKLSYDGKYYPPKLVVSLAAGFVNGKKLDSSDFGGGIETNSFLEQLGFKVVGDATLVYVVSKAVPKRIVRGRHDERCPKCKEAVKAMLEKVYGGVESNYKIDVGALPDAFSGSQFYGELKGIFSSLKSFRGHEDFVRSASLPRVDFFVPNPGFIVEFDESQHFTACRKESLLKYPDGLRVGYEVKRWIRLCEEIGARDNDPPFRDEQRAWYDALRDFLPTIKNFAPTVRLFSSDMEWCRLSPDNPSDVRRFKQILEGKESKPAIEVKADPNATLARIIIAGNWAGEVKAAKELLIDVCYNWPAGKKVDCLITCGAFLSFPWPEALTDVGDNKFPEKRVLDLLITEAKKQIDLLLGEELRTKLALHTKYLTIGIDSRKEKISFSNTSINQLHVELVAMIDLKENKYFWAGKSFPTSGQEYGLVRFQDMGTHFVRTSFGKAMILGCHDLNAFNKRGQATTKAKWRKKARQEFYAAAKKEMPDVVLHHPHTTDHAQIWTAAWNELARTAPSIKRYIGSGRYFREEGERSSVEDVLKATKLGGSIDFICRKVYKEQE